MARQMSLKRRLLQEAVARNVEEMNGLRRRPGRRRPRVALTVFATLFFLGLPLAILISTYFLVGAAEAWVETSRVRLVSRTPPPGLAPLQLGDLAVAPTAAPQFIVPQPLDRSVMPLSLRKIVLDPGHGGGNRGTEVANGLVEKEVTLDLARRLRDLLLHAGYQVVLTREADDAISLEERAVAANTAEGDIFISIHVNWLADQEMRGVETFYLGPTDDPYLKELAAQENRDSGYSLADLKVVLERVYADVRQEESRQLATAVQAALYRSMRDVDEAIRDRGVKSAPFGVLVRTEMPAILAEVSSLSNEAEARRLQQPSYRQLIAEALLEGIHSYSSLLNMTDARREAPDDGRKG